MLMACEVAARETRFLCVAADFRRVVVLLQYLFFLLLVFEPFASAQSAPVASVRELPLNHFAYHIPHPAHPDGWIRMETAVGDDYFDGTSSVQRVRRHLKTARALGVRYLRCSFTWNAI